MEQKKSLGNLATPVNRILATLVDTIIVVIVTTIVTLPFGAVSVLTTLQSFNTDNVRDLTALAGANQGSSFIAAFLGLAVWALAFLVVPIFVWKGQTIGKKLLKIKIADMNGMTASQELVLKRYSLYIGLNIAGIIPGLNFFAGCASPILALVNLVMLFTDEKRQTLLDKVGGTLVVIE
jgi:uncharacterized RDD family membrane protein YckC